MNLIHFKKKGYTLIEVLIAVAILAIIIPIFFSFLNKAIFKIKFHSSLNDAIFLAQQKVEELFDKKFSDDSLKDTNISNDNSLLINVDKSQIENNFSSYVNQNFDHYELVNLNNKNYYIFWNIADDNTISSLTTIKRIVVIVFWISEGKGHQVSIKTFLRDIS